MSDTALVAGGIPSFLVELFERCESEGTRADVALSDAIAEIDRRVHAQLDEILHAEPFRRLESAWNSLEYLISQKPPDRDIIVRVLNVRRDELLADFEDAIEFDRSASFLHIYETEFGVFGGTPYGVVVADFEFCDAPDDIEILTGLAGVCAAAHAILLTGASAELLGMDTWTSLGPARIPEEVAAPAWDSLRRHVDARYLGLVMPRILLRRPYRPGDPDRTIHLRENSFAVDGSGLLWGNAAFALATRIMVAFHLYGWCTAIRGLEDDAGVVDGLPEISFPSDAPGVAVPPPVEVAVTESIETALTDLGLIPLCRVAGGPRVAFFGTPSLHRPQRVDDPVVTSNLRLGAQIPYMLAASRIAHYMKVMMRDHVGTFASPDEIRRELSDWLSRYTVADDDATIERQARYPLRDFDVTVREKPGKPGHLEAITRLQPHYQIEVPDVNLRLAVDLPDPEKTAR